MSISQNFPSTRPSLNLNFARSQKLDPRITFTRSSSATYTGGDGLIKSAATNTPRFDFNATTGDCLGLLIEESRTNLITYSEDFANAAWGSIYGQNAPVTANQVAAPDGNTTADLITFTPDGTGQSRKDQNLGTQSGTYTASVFVKNGTIGQINLYVTSSQAPYPNVAYNFNTDTITGNGATASRTLYPNGWVRITATATVTSHGMYPALLASSSGTLYAWGFQVELASFPTSYIATVASTVTRTADNASITGTNFSSFYNPSEGTLFAAARVQNTSSTDRYIAEIYKDNSNVSASLRINSATFYGYTRNSGTFVGDVSSGTNVANSTIKSSYSYKTNDIGLCVSGGTIAADISAAIPTDMNTFLIGGYNSGAAQYCGSISQLLYYPVRLSNSQLQNLTK